MNCRTIVSRVLLGRMIARMALTCNWILSVHEQRTMQLSYGAPCSALQTGHKITIDNGRSLLRIRLCSSGTILFAQILSARHLLTNANYIVNNNDDSMFAIPGCEKLSSGGIGYIFLATKACWESQKRASIRKMSGERVDGNARLNAFISLWWRWWRRAPRL